MIVLLTVGSLLLGLAYGFFDLENALISILTEHTDIVFRTY